MSDEPSGSTETFQPEGALVVVIRVVVCIVGATVFLFFVGQGAISLMEFLYDRWHTTRFDRDRREWVLECAKHSDVKVCKDRWLDLMTLKYPGFK